jgi:hypothetical protein
MKIKRFKQLNENNNLKTNEYITSIDYTNIIIDGLNEETIDSASAKIYWNAKIDQTTDAINGITANVTKVELEFDLEQWEGEPKDTHFEFVIEDSDKILVDDIHSRDTLPFYPSDIVFDTEDESVIVNFNV